MTEERRRALIPGLALLTIVAPLPVMSLLTQMVASSKPFRSMPEDVRMKWLFGIATLGSAAGLPFGIKLLRTIRSDGAAGATSIILSGYGLVVWVLLYIMLGALFMKSCC